MERFKKSVFCKTLNKEVIATFYVNEIKHKNGDLKLKAVEFYKCEGKKECGNEIVMDCSCLHELKRVEWEINQFNK